MTSSNEFEAALTSRFHDSDLMLVYPERECDLDVAAYNAKDVADFLGALPSNKSLERTRE